MRGLSALAEKRRISLPRTAPALALAGLVALGFLIVLYETRGLSFYFDDWEFVLHRRGLSADVLLRPHGPHLSLIPILAYKSLLAVFGGGSYLPFRVLAALDLALLAAVVGLVCRRLWGSWWGLVPVLLIVTLGPGAWTLLWPFQVGYAVAVTAGLLALIALQRAGPAWEAAAALLLIVSLASGSQGVGFLAGAAVLLALQRRGWRSAWTVAVPAVLYGAWYLKYGHQASETHLSLWRDTLPYTARSLSSTVAGTIGLGAPTGDLPPQLDPSFGIPIVLGAVVLGVLAWRRGWRPPPLFWAAAATVLVLIIAASLSNVADTRRPTDTRYLSTNVALLLVALCAAVPRPRIAGRPALLVVLGAVLVVALTNAGQFTPERNQMLATSVASRAEVGATLILRGVVPPTFSPVPPFTTGLVNDVQAGPLYSAVDAFGILADSPAELARQGEGTRELADGVLARGEELGLVFTATRPAGGSCTAVFPAARALSAPPGTYVLRAARTAPLQAAMGRFGTAFSVTLGTVPAGRTATVHVPADRAPGVPWRMLVSGAGAVCR